MRASKQQSQNKQADAGGTTKEFNFWDAIGLMSNLGFSLFLCVFLGIIGGRWLDQRLGTTPWFLLTGALLGAAAAGKMLYDLLMKKWMK